MLRKVWDGLFISQEQQVVLSSNFEHQFLFIIYVYWMQSFINSWDVVLIPFLSHDDIHVKVALIWIIQQYFVFSSDEAEMQFPPTYKYKKGDRLVYDWRKEKRTEVGKENLQFCEKSAWIFEEHKTRGFIIIFELYWKVKPVSLHTTLAELINN